MLKKIFLSTSLLILAACSGGSSGGGSPGSGSISGTFKDSPVGGVYYRSDSHIGMTDDNGKYTCKSGEMVEFYLKGDDDKEIHLGQVACRGITSPIELVTQGNLDITIPLANVPAIEQSKIVRMLRLLQSLDSDGNPSNGITMRPSDISKLSTHLESSYGQGNLNIAMNSVFSSPSFDLELGTVMTDIGRASVSELDAIDHFNSQNSSPPASCDGMECPEDGGSNHPPMIPPVVIQDECLEGLSYATSVFSQSGTQKGPSNVLTPSGDLNSNAGFVELTKTWIVLHPDQSSQVYREKNNTQSYRFRSLGYSVQISGEIIINSVAFSNVLANLSLSTTQDLGGGIMGRYGSAVTFGTMSSSFERMFRRVSCSNIPTNIVPLFED